MKKFVPEKTKIKFPSKKHLICQIKKKKNWNLKNWEQIIFWREWRDMETKIITSKGLSISVKGHAHVSLCVTGSNFSLNFMPLMVLCPWLSLNQHHTQREQEILRTDYIGTHTHNTHYVYRELTPKLYYSISSTKETLYKLGETHKILPKAKYLLLTPLIALGSYAQK